MAETVSETKEYATEGGQSAKKRSLFLVACVFMIVLGAAAGLMALGMCTGSFGFAMFKSWIAHPYLLLLNLIPPALICLFFYALFGRPWLGFLVGAGLCLAVGFAQSVKIAAFGDVILFQDFRRGGEGLSFFPPLSQLSLSWLMIGALVFLVAGTVLLVRLFRGRKVVWFAGRVLFAMIAAGAFGMFSVTAVRMGGSADAAPYLDNTAMIDTRSSTQQYISKGLFFPFIESAFSGDPNEAPGGYTEGRAAEMMSSYQDSQIPEDKKVSIIAVQLESFADFSGCEAPSVDLAGVYADLQRLKDGSVSGTLISYYTGQDCSDAGRNVLSGYSRLPGIRKQTESYVRYLQRQGYDCWGMHPDYPDIYSHARLYRELGFAAFGYMGGRFEEFASGSGFYNSDWYLFGEAYKDFTEKSKDGTPQFAFIETTQNQAPYGKSFAEDITDGSLDKETAAVLSSYFTGVKDTLFYLLNFLDRLEALDEPAVAVIYGDNRPDLGGAAYAALGIDSPSGAGIREADLSANYYIWANSAAKAKLGGEFTGVGPKLSLNFLMGKVFSLCGWEGSAFMKVSGQAASVLPVITSERIGLFSTGGALVPAGKLTLDQQTVLYNYLYQEYYCSYR